MISCQTQIYDIIKTFFANVATTGGTHSKCMSPFVRKCSLDRTVAVIGRARDRGMVFLGGYWKCGLTNALSWWRASPGCLNIFSFLLQQWTCYLFHHEFCEICIIAQTMILCSELIFKSLNAQNGMCSAQRTKWELLNLWLPWCGMVTIKENGKTNYAAP